MTVKLAVIGAGFMGRNHARVIRELSKNLDVDLVAVVDVDPVKARRVAEEYRCRAFTSIGRLLESGTVFNAATIATPTSTHRDVALKLLEAGIDYLFIEKPLAASLDEGLDIARKAKELGARVMVGHIERFNPVVEELLEAIESGLLGDVLALTARRVGPARAGVMDVGVIYDLGIHDIDIANVIYKSRPVQVYAAVSKVLTPDKEDSAYIMLRYPKGVAFVEANRVTPYKERRLIATGSEGVAQLDYIAQELIIYREKWEMKLKRPWEEPLKRELKAFIESVLSRSEPPIPCEEALNTLRVAEAALESARLGRPVETDIFTD